LTIILWHSGVQILIFLSGLQSIPNTLYEASRVDGATEWENLWFITVPMMTPMVLLNLVYTVVDTFNDSSNEIISYMQQYAFQYSQHSYAAAIGMFFMFFAVLLVALVFLVMRPFTKNVKS
jgi:ABC-type sugar transport system permease subunit